MNYEQRHKAITQHLSNGGRVVVATYTQATVYSPKHVGLFSWNATGLYVQAGKRRDCISYCAIKFC